MVIITKSEISQESLDNLIKGIKEKGLEVDISRGKGSILLGLIGDTHELNEDRLLLNPDVEKISRRPSGLRKTSE